MGNSDIRSQHFQELPVISDDCEYSWKPIMEACSEAASEVSSDVMSTYVQQSLNAVPKDPSSLLIPSKSECNFQWSFTCKSGS